MINKIRQLLGYKDSQARIALSFNQVGQPVMTPKNYDGFARHGYSKNVIVYRCVAMIAESCAGIGWDAFRKDSSGDKIEVDEHPILKLLARPNPMQGRSAFIESVVGFYKLTGNTYIEGVGPSLNRPPLELWSARPDRMKIIAGPKGYPLRYEFTANNITKTWPVDQVTFQSMMKHLKTWNPLNDWYGMSPLEAAMMALDASNHGQRWNLALLQNSATPSGVLQVVRTDKNPNGVLAKDKFEQLKSDLEESFQGSSNAGRPLVLEGGLDWKTIALSPKDMEFIESKNSTAIDICNAFGVPPELLGLGQKTFKNYAEARLAFYEETILPMMDTLEGELNHWLAPMYGDGIYLCYDKDDIEALAIKREAKFTSIKDANFLTINEKREAAGYEALPGWDVILIGNELMEEPPDDTEVVEPEPTETPIQNPEPEETDPEDGQEDEKAFKSFNLLNSNEKKRSWRNQERRKKRLARNFERDLQSDFDELARDIEAAVKSSLDPKVQEFAILRAIDANEPTIEKTMKRHIGYSVREFGDGIFQQAKQIWPGKHETKATRVYEDWAARYIAKQTGQHITTIMGTSRKKVQSIVKRLTQETIEQGFSNAELAAELRSEFEGLSKGRSRTIARTEVQMASNNASIEAVKSLQIPGMMKEWVTAQDDRVRDDDAHADHSAMDGTEVEIDEKFVVPPDSEMDGPGDSSAPPEQVINCRCVLTFKSRNNGEL